MAADPGLLMVALKLMVIGMGFVLLMLGVMVLAIKILSWLARQAEETAILPITLLGRANTIPPEHVAAIAAAIHHHHHLRLASSNSTASPRQEERK